MPPAGNSKHDCATRQGPQVDMSDFPPWEGLFSSSKAVKSAEIIRANCDLGVAYQLGYTKEALRVLQDQFISFAGEQKQRLGALSMYNSVRGRPILLTSLFDKVNSKTLCGIRQPHVLTCYVHPVVATAVAKYAQQLCVLLLRRCTAMR
eukprot:6158171-Amphidinium_carterae.2